VRVPDSEGVANHTVPESCAWCREAPREALTGVRAGQQSSHESHLFRGADAVTEAEGNTDRRASASICPTLRGLRTWHARTLLAREPGDLSSGQLLYWDGPCREGEEPKPVMHGREKSDSAIVAMKPANKAGQPAAEWAERRAGAEGNTVEPRMRRTLRRISVPQRLDCVRHVASCAAVTYPRWEPGA